MTKKEILKKVIYKVYNNGCNYLQLDINNYQMGWDLEPDISAYYYIIFRKEFAKAFWGEEEVCGYCGEICCPKAGDFCYNDECSLSVDYPNPIKAWKYHLQQIVLEEEPLKYLEKFL